MKRQTFTFVIALIMSLLSYSAEAQIFDGGAKWRSDEKTLITAKWSQLYYELNMGWNVSGYKSYANFIYFGIGVGYPVNKKNAWCEFLPKQKAPSNEAEAELLGAMSTDDVYGGKLGIGWIHYFNHAIGFYTQLSWGFLADFGSPSDDGSSTSSDSNSKNTFIYNTIPIEVGICVNCLKHLNLQGGVTYMWKEIPIATVGIGYNF